MLKNAYLLAKIDADTAETLPIQQSYILLKCCQKLSYSIKLVNILDHLAMMDALCSPCSRSVFTALRISMHEGHMGKACTEDVPCAVKIDYG